MASQASVDAFRALGEDQQRAALGRMSDEAKQALLGGLNKYPAAPVGPSVVESQRQAGAPQVTKPSPSMSTVRTLTGTPYNPSPTERKIVDQVGGFGQQLANVSAPVIAHRVAQRVGVMGKGSRIYPDEGTLEDTARDATLLVAPEAAVGTEAAATLPRGKTVPKPPAEPSLTPEQGAAIDKANRGYVEAKAQLERKGRLESASKQAVTELHQNLRDTYKAVRGSLDQRWNSFRTGMEGADLDAAQAFNRIEEAKSKYLKGSPSSLRQFNDLAREMGIQQFMEGAGGELKAVPGTGSLPFDTARVHYSAIGDKLAQGNLPGNVYQALKSVQEGLDTQLSAAAEQRGLGKEYQSLKADEAQFRKDWTDPKSPLAKAHQALDPNFLEPKVLGRGNEYISNQMRRYREYGAKPHLPLAAKRIADEAATITKRIPEVKELPKPKESAPKASKLARGVGRIGGKIVGGSVGSAVGHPLLGYSVGGEVGTEAAERLARRRKTVPAPPE